VRGPRKGQSDGEDPEMGHNPSSPRPPRIAELFLGWTLPGGVAGESVKGDLEQEFRRLRRTNPGGSHGAWYLWEALKLGARFGLYRLAGFPSKRRGRPGAGTGSGGSVGGWIFQEIGQGIRLLRRTPGLAAFAVISMGLGIGATSTMFSVSHGLLRELPYPDSDALVYVGWTPRTSPDDHVYLTASELSTWQSTQSTLESLAAVRMTAMDLAGAEGAPERVNGGQVTRTAFETLRVSPILGRGFRSEETVPGGPEVVILGHGLWTRRFGGDPEILGRTLRVNGTARTVVGVMPRGFRFPELEDLWVPIQLAPVPEGAGDEPRIFMAFGRLAEGRLLREAQSEFAALAGRLQREEPERYENLLPLVIPYHGYFVGRDAVLIMNTLVVIASFVLLIACGSVANLFLARAAGRTRELAVRSALGAGRSRILGQLMSEALVIAVLGGVLGALVAYAGAALFHRSISAQLPFFWMDCRVDGTVLVFVGALVLLAGGLAGIVPALRASGIGAAAALRDGDRGSSSLRIGRLSRTLVVAEVTLSFGLLATAGMLAKGPLVNARKDPGFETDGLLAARVSLRRDVYPDSQAWRAFAEELQRGLASLPDVQEAALSSAVPALAAPTWRFQLQGAAYDRPVDLPLARVAVVSPDFFPTLGASPLEGRLLDDGDHGDGAPVAVVNQSFARRHFPGESPVGRQVRPGGLDEEGPWLTIVGVVPDLGMNGARTTFPEGFYIPLQQRPQRSIYVLLRSSGDPVGVAARLREYLAGIDPDLPLLEAGTVRSALTAEVRPEMAFTMLLAICGAIALVLAAVGLFGVLAFSVRRRTREIGVRLALGAEVRNVLWKTLGGGMSQVAAGIGVGAGIALGLSLIIRDLYASSELVDWTIYGAIAGLMLVTGLAASLFPALRAVRVDPAEALRRE